MTKTPDQIINEQFQRWSLQQSLIRRGRTASKPWPIITISREVGAGGPALAEILADRTGFSVWDKDLLQAIADERGCDVRMMQTLDERRQKVVDDAVRGALKGQVTNYQYVQSLLRVVHTLAAHGSAIVVGRGAHCICTAEEALRVRVVCPYDRRVREYAAHQNVPVREASRLVDQVEADRAAFVRSTFKRDVADPTDYDLVLNAETLSQEGIADVVLATYEAKMGRCPAHVEVE